VGDLGYTWGWTTFTAPGGTPAPGHYMAMWRKDRQSRGHGNRAYTLQVYMRYTALPRTPPPAGFGPLAPPVDVGDRIDEAHALTQLNTLDNEFSALAVAKGQPAAHAEFAAPDAVELLTDVTYGRDAIVASHANDGFVLSWISSGGGMSASGDLGYTTGPFVVTVPGTTISIPGHFLTIWKRQPDGQWRYVVGSGT
jgi:ketosteroid isomerase-like protein